MKLVLLTLILILLVTVAIWLGWLGFSVRDLPKDKSEAVVTVDKGEVKKDWQAAKEKVEGWSRRTPERDQAGQQHSQLKPETDHLELNVGTATRIRVARSGDDLKATQLKFSTTPGSKLVVSGGEFAEGQKDTAVTIEVPRDATDGDVYLQLGDGDRTAIKINVVQPAAYILQERNPTVRF